MRDWIRLKTEFRSGEGDASPDSRRSERPPSMFDVGDVGGDCSRSIDTETSSGICEASDDWSSVVVSRFEC